MNVRPSFVPHRATMLLVALGACSGPTALSPARMVAPEGGTAPTEGGAGPGTGGEAGPREEAGNAGPASDSGPDGQAVRAWDWVGIVGTGQSLFVGAYGSPITATTQRYQNLKLSLGTAIVPPFDPTIGGLSMVPLVEPIRPMAQTYPSAYPMNLYGETPHTARRRAPRRRGRSGGRRRVDGAEPRRRPSPPCAGPCSFEP